MLTLTNHLWGKESPFPHSYIFCACCSFSPMQPWQFSQDYVIYILHRSVWIHTAQQE